MSEDFATIVKRASELVSDVRQELIDAQEVFRQLEELLEDKREDE